MNADWILSALPWIQVILSCLLAICILVQRSEAGLGTAFGDSGDAVIHARRGAEKFIFQTTIILAVLFALVSLIALIARQ